MTCLRTPFPVLVCSLILAACADQTKVAPAATPETAKEPQAEAPKYKKPPRMNGRGEVSSVSFEEFFALQQSGKALIFDARPAFFYNLGHIPGAINLPKNHCDETIAARESEIKAALADGKSLVVYCTSMTCPDARTVAIHISGFGYPVKTFSGGWDRWKQAGMPVE
jgi:rhodanese-related sulfurtransferase